MRRYVPHEGEPPPAKKGSRHARSHRVLNKMGPSIVRSIADAIVIKEQDIYFLTEPGGNVPLGEGHGFGLYYHDCRYLSGYELRVAGVRPNALASIVAEGYKARFELTNPEIAPAGHPGIRMEQLGIQWERILEGETPALHDRLTLHNFDHVAHHVTLSLTFQSGFEDVFEVRGMHGMPRGQLEPPTWQDQLLILAYQGRDGLRRQLMIHFSLPPTEQHAGQARFAFKLEPGAEAQLKIHLAVVELPQAMAAHLQPVPEMKALEERLKRKAQRWHQGHATIATTSLLLDRIMTRSLHDLHILRSRLDQDTFFAAGIPWFATLFGRDSLVTALQALAFDPSVAADTLRLLAKHQGTHQDDWRDEAAGKILHELRIGEFAHLNEVPFTPYYGSVDATPLFLILVGAHARWTGDLTLFLELSSHIEAALGWIDRQSRHFDGFLSYESSSRQGLANQGWKDSGDAIVNEDGSLVQPPVALAEVQGYVFLAKRLLADLYERKGDPSRAQALRQEAETLRRHFEEAFWCEELDCYVLALQNQARPARVIASNAGQVLWSGIADPDRARRVTRRLMEEDMFSGWGVRTLSARERRYNPIGYHVGSVWPHDNSLIASGMRRYGHDTAAYRIFLGMFEAASHFDQYRMPELFTGYGRVPFGEPVRYPVACHPQAWAAGTLPYLLVTLLGLEPDAFASKLTVVRPQLPHFVEEVILSRLQVGSACLDLRFHRQGREVAVEILAQEGELQVEAERGRVAEAP